MSSALRPRGSRRRSGERGAVAVEAALVLPILLTLVFGIIEFSLVLRDQVAISSAVRVGARIASANPGAGPATCSPSPCAPPSAPKLSQMAADAIQTAGTTMPQNSIRFVIVYQSNKLGYPAPTGTTTANISGTATTGLPAAASTAPCASYANCVAYKWSTSAGKFVYSDGGWSSATIDACPTTAYDVGVFMAATHPTLTGWFKDHFDLGDHTVMKFEPLEASQCNSLASNPHL